MKQINYDIIKENIRLAHKKHDLILVLKDNAYGFGISKVALIAGSVGVYSFAVKSLSEAILIKKKIPNAFILLLGVTNINLETIKKYDLCVTVNTMNEYFYYSKNEINMHIELDLGMNRFGLKTITNEMLENKYVKGIYFHSPSISRSYNRRLLEKFRVYNNSKLYMHVGGSQMLELEHGYAVRLGRIIYENSITFTARIIKINVLNKGEALGYNMQFIATSKTYVAVINVGYANGLARVQKNNYCYINNKKYYFAGLRCMDQSFLIVDESIKNGDEVTLIGKNISMSEFASMNNKSVYEAYLQLK